MRRNHCNFALVILAVACTIGCVASSAEGDRPIQKEALQLDSQDIERLSDQQVQALMDSGVLDEAPQHPGVYSIGRIENHTHQFLDTDLLSKKIRVALSKSSKALCSLRDTTNTTWVISGTISETYARSGRAV